MWHDFNWASKSNDFLKVVRLIRRVTVSSAAFLFIYASPSFAQLIPNTTQNSPGELLSGPVDPDMGRLAVIQLLGNQIITIPETPGSELGDHQRTQSWDISNPSNPILTGSYGRTGNPILAHGSYARANEVYTGFDSQTGNNAVRLNDNGSLSHVRWSGPTAPELFQRVPGQPGVPGQPLNRRAQWFSKGAMMQPWAINDNWSYNSPNNTATLTLRNILMAEWDITADTGGASGFGNFFGNLLIYVSDQLRGGVAIYDATDIITQNGISRPRLLDIFNLPASEGGVGGYWSEISGHYIVIGREKVGNQPNSFDGIQIINFEDPTNIRQQCQTELVNPNADQSFALESRPRYPGLQDEFAFVDGFKINIETCEMQNVVDVTGGGPRGTNLCIFNPNDNTCPQRIVDVGEYNRPIGNLVIGGGFPVQPNIDGMSIWAHQAAPDTRPPFIAHQIPAANQINYPINAPLGFSIPETLRVETIITSENRRSGQTDSVTVTAVGEDGNLVNGGLVDIDYVLSHQGMLTLNPVNLLAEDTTYEVSFTNGIQDAVGNGMQATSFRFSTGNELILADGSGNNGGGNNGEAAVISNVTVSPSNTVFINESLTISVTSPNANSYQIALDNEEQNFSSQSSRTFTFTNPGTFFINVRARNEIGDSSLQRISVQVRADNLQPGNHSSQLACDANSNTVWAVNPDNDSVTILRASDLIKLDEVTGVDDPQAAALVNDEIWVASRNSDQIVIYDANTRGELRTIDTGFGSAPTHLLASSDSQYMYVTLYGTGELARYRTDGGNNSPELITLAPTVKAMALSPDGGRLLVNRFISPENWGEVFDVNTSNWQLDRTFRLNKHLVEDTLNEGRGKPNYLAAVIINGSNDRAYVVGKKDNTDRGLLNSSLDLDPDNSVRTIVMTLDLENNQELRAQRVDLDNTSSLSALAMNGSQTLFIAEQGRNAVRALQIGPDLRFTGQISSLQTGLAPQGLCFDNQLNTLFVKNFTDRSVTSIDISNGLSSAVSQNTSTVDNETLTASELRGLQLFYNAFEGLTNSQPVGIVSGEGYISCASCHLDGGHDGNTWDFTGRGEGLRNNISLKGRGGVRFGDLRWSANFDEIQDFEDDIRAAFGGLGFLTDNQFANSSPLGSPKAGLNQDLDNLAAYVASLGRESLPRSSSRSANGGLSTAANAGRQAFVNQGCAQCHSGSALSDNIVHDVGTLRSSSGQRLGEELPGIKTPSLLGVFDSAPYLHDGSAKTLSDVFNTVGGTRFEFDNFLDFQFNAEAITQDGFSYLRNGTGVRLNGNDALVGQFNDYSNGVAGPAKIRIRYGSSTSGGQLQISIADEVQTTISLETLPQVEGQDVAFTETPSIDVTLPDAEFGFNISVRYLGDTSVIIDEFTVSNADDLAKAQVHLRAEQLSSTQFTNLVTYLSSQDQVSAPDDNEADIFSNSNEPDDPGDPGDPDDPDDPDTEVAAGNEICFPIAIKDTQRFAIICL